MPEDIKLKENHICSRCHHKILKGQIAKVWHWGAGKEEYRHIDTDCKKHKKKHKS